MHWCKTIPIVEENINLSTVDVLKMIIDFFANA